MADRHLSWARRFAKLWKLAPWSAGAASHATPRQALREDWSAARASYAAARTAVAAYSERDYRPALLAFEMDLAAIDANASEAAKAELRTRIFAMHRIEAIEAALQALEDEQDDRMMALLMVPAPTVSELAFKLLLVGKFMPLDEPHMSVISSLTTDALRLTSSGNC